MKPNLLSAVALIACVVLAALLFRAQREAADAKSQLAALAESKEKLASDVAALQSKIPSDADRARLEADSREAIRLRGEVANLKKAVTEANAAASAAMNSASKAKAQAQQPTSEPENPYVRTFSRKFTADVGVGHAVVFGGWQTAPGKQTFALAVPSTPEDSPAQVLVQTKLFDITDEALSKLDSSMLVRAAGQQASMTPDQLAAFIKSLETTPGVDILSSPNIITLSGRQAMVSVTSSLKASDGTEHELGPSIGLLPTLGPDGNTVSLGVDAKLVLARDQPATEKQ